MAYNYSLRDLATWPRQMGPQANAGMMSQGRGPVSPYQSPPGLDNMAQIQGGQGQYQHWGGDEYIPPQDGAAPFYGQMRQPAESGMGMPPQANVATSSGQVRQQYGDQYTPQDAISVPASTSGQIGLNGAGQYHPGTMPPPNGADQFRPGTAGMMPPQDVRGSLRYMLTRPQRPAPRVGQPTAPSGPLPRPLSTRQLG